MIFDPMGSDSRLAMAEEDSGELSGPTWNETLRAFRLDLGEGESSGVLSRAASEDALSI